MSHFQSRLHVWGWILWNAELRLSLISQLNLICVFFSLDIFSMHRTLWFGFLLLLNSAKDNFGKCQPCLWGGTWEWREKDRTKYSTLLFTPIPEPPPGPSKVMVFAYNWGAFYVTNSSIYSVRLPLPSVVCVFTFYDISEKGSFCDSKMPKPWWAVRGLFMDNKICISCAETVGGLVFVAHILVMLHWPQLTTQVQNSFLFFNCADVKCLLSNPITRGIFWGCTRSILEEAVCHIQFVFWTAALRALQESNCKASSNCGIYLGYRRIWVPLRILWPTLTTRDFEGSRNTQTNHEPLV